MSFRSHYIEGRRFEWTITFAMMWLAIVILYAPITLRASAFQWMTLVMSPGFTGLTLLTLGGARLVGLLLNGHKVRNRRIGPLIRASTAVLCAVMWVQFDLALVNLSHEQGFMSPGIPFWSMFVIGEIDVAYRAVADDGRNS